MNQKEWRKLRCSIPSGEREAFFYYRNLASQILCLKKGYVIHHLRDSEEARIFNDTYYERWGIDFDGVCKYCILMTEEDHRKYHSLSEETRNKIGESNRITKSKKEYKDKVSGKNSYLYGKKKVFTEEQKKTISEKRKLYLSDPEHRKQLSDSRIKYFKDHPLTEEQKKIISEKTREAMKDPCIKEKCSKAKKGKSLSEETRKKISEGNKGKIISKEIRKKISNSIKGHIVSEETRKKISEKHIGFTHTEETRDKMSKSSFSRKASVLYRNYKDLGGILDWNQWQKANYPNHDKGNML